MVIDRALFAQECVRQGVFFGVNPHYLLAVAKLGGYLARTKDPPPGNMVVWRGLTRLTDLCLGFELNDPVVGN
jgi:hypothetical protein